MNSDKNGNLNFSGQKLRGQNFAGQNLSEANFSHCDIRGANFKRANLTGANFTGATAGLQKRRVIGLLLVALMLILVSSLSSVFMGVIILFIFNPDTFQGLMSTLEIQMTGWIGLIVLLIFCIISYFQQLGKALIIIVTIVGITIAISVATTAIGFPIPVTVAVTQVFVSVIAGTIIVSGSLIVSIAFILFSSPVFAIILASFTIILSNLVALVYGFIAFDVLMAI